MRNALAILAYSYGIFIVVASLAKFVIHVFPDGVPNSDKYAHAAAYMVFVIIWGAYLNSKTSEESKVGFVKQLVKAFFIAVVLGVFMEFAQWGLTSYRQFDVLDMLANTLGAALGLLIMRLSIKYLVLIKKVGIRFFK
ncbi:VanZ family protein [Aquimarina agarivorans]|uniref:VanZ family protein n=1 Tax=Aquimarina agarivorans TaxID=980584 RepID=UPI000248F56D|nr:VanZ family protein [Aquimarina agarivorans]